MCPLFLQRQCHQIPYKTSSHPMPPLQQPGHSLHNLLTNALLSPDPLFSLVSHYFEHAYIGASDLLSSSSLLFKTLILAPHKYTPNSTSSSQSHTARETALKDPTPKARSLKNQEYEYKNQWHNTQHKILWMFTALVFNIVCFELFVFCRPFIDTQSSAHRSKLPASHKDLTSLMPTLLNPIVNVFMMTGEINHGTADEGSHNIQSGSPHRPQQTSSNQPLPSSRLTLDQKVSRRIRRNSDMTNSSVSSRSSRSSANSTINCPKIKKKRDYSAKLIDVSGIHQLDLLKKKCTLCYIDDFLNSNEEDELANCLQDCIQSSAMNTEAPTSSLDFNFTDNPTVNDDLEKRMKFLKRLSEGSHHSKTTSPMNL